MWDGDELDKAARDANAVVFQGFFFGKGQSTKVFTAQKDSHDKELGEEEKKKHLLRHVAKPRRSVYQRPSSSNEP